MSDPQASYLDPYDDAPWSTPREIFARLGYFPPAPEELDEASLCGRLWEMIHAMAARRFFLINTNHLSDAELYAYLYYDWLDESTADVPPEAGWNCQIDVSETADQEVWLKYYADEMDREDWRLSFPDKPMPESTEPPYDRDDWLPTPLGPDAGDTVDLIPGAGGFSDGFGELEEDFDDDDPLGLREVEDAIHQDDPMGDGFENNDLSSGEEDDEEGGDERDDPNEDDLGPTGRWARPMDMLADHGVDLLPPAELTDESVAPRLWEVLQAMAAMGVFVMHTDHMTDRELYEALWARVLRDEAFVPGPGMEAAWAHDFIGSEDEEDRRIRLSYYASDEEREAAAEESGGPLPPRMEPVANRDWRLPRSSLV